jgi:LCP family protein required for cell wall assembly
MLDEDTQPMYPRPGQAVPPPDPSTLELPPVGPPDLPYPDLPPVGPALPPSPPSTPPDRVRRVKETARRWARQIPWQWVRRVGLVLLVVVVVLLGLLLHRAYDFGTAISNQPPLSSQLPSSGRVNLAFLGYGGPGHDGPYLTDSMLVVSLDRDTGQSALISVPRDLWVQVPPNSGQYAKLNTAYAYGIYNGGPYVGGKLADEKLTEILGMNVPYFISIDFGGFQEMVDAMGGVDIDVPDTFVASLSPEHYGARRFYAGEQHMDGATALLFARARYCEPPAEASDFARSLRQQILMRAIAARLKSPLHWNAIPGVMDALQSRVVTNLSLRDLYTIYSSVDFGQAKHIALTNQNVLVDAVSGDGQDILLPRNGDWGLIVQYVQQQLNQ